VETGSLLDKITIAANISALVGAATTSFITGFKSLSTIPGIGKGLSNKLVTGLTVLKKCNLPD
jgi:hypothetical protein